MRNGKSAYVMGELSLILRRKSPALMLGLLPILLFTPITHAVVFSGEVQAVGAQNIFTPPSMSSPVVLRYFAVDGQPIKRGDELLRIDAGSTEADVIKLRAKIVQLAEKRAKEIAELELKESDAKLALADAQAERDLASLDAAIPRNLVPALNFDRYQSEMQRTEQALTLKKLQAEEATKAVASRREDGDLEMRKLRLQLDFSQSQLEEAVVHATTDGVVIHGFDNIFGSGGRYEEGSSSYPGQKVGEVIGQAQGYQVRAWILEPDRLAIRTGQEVRLHFDALPGASVVGAVRSVAGASEQKREWGDGRYVAIEIELPTKATLPLRPGMSVRVDSELSEAADQVPVAAATHEITRVEGEVFAQSSAAISPPAVSGLWQLTVTQMATDGQVVKKGDVVVTFDATQVTKDLGAKQGELSESQRKQEELTLDLADRAKEVELATAQAQAEAEKARRKADLPKDYIAGIEYKKLLVARQKTDTKLGLTIHRANVAREARAAEQRMADAEVDQLQQEVRRLQTSLAALTVAAPRDGIVLHQNAWSGDKVDVGSQVWRGQSVAKIPDLQSLAVRAMLPERELTHVREGQSVRVVLSGGAGHDINGTVREIGHNVHSKSRVDAIPVVDVIIQLAATVVKLKPGQPVQVYMGAPTQADQ